ncbi:zinc metalloprotease [Coprinellus micaceus]|uniref:Disintegrin and metalloproteinase domain-containing protein B n=1 Tax=Coprinellus micaceus TaxID=71717 RepID=A0A4Y7TN22_COPMI|nr:zinc metalloprotease [Coprinellus micaceus]
MKPFNYLVTLVVIIATACHASAHSTHAPLLKRATTPATLALEILPRQQHVGTILDLTKRSPTPSPHTLRFDDSFRLTISAFDEAFHLHLRPNDHLVHPEARINYYGLDSDGAATVLRTEPIVRETVKAYMDTIGVVRYRPHPAELGWARIMVHHQGDSDRQTSPVYEGAFSVGGVIYHITTKENYDRKKHALDPEVVETLDDGDNRLVIWRESDAMTPEEEHFVKTDAPTGNGGMGSNFVDNIGQSVGCPTTQKVLYMGVAADCEYVQKQDGQENAKRQILTTWNTASALYKDTFNVSLGITTLNVQDSNCPATPGEFIWNVPCSAATLSSRLSLFSEWRGTVSEDGNGLWHLMSGCPTGAEVGIAWLATICQTRTGGSPGAVTSGTGVSTSGRTEWQVVAHEIGHNFGAIHDCADGCASDSSKCCPLNSQTCDAQARFIMSPVAQAGEKVFSPCSLGNICILMQGTRTGGKTDTSCIIDPDASKTTISLKMCGNGIVDKEQGEECDPGPNPKTDCCDPTTCKLRTNAVCDPDSSDCCTDQCGFAPATRVCRPSKDDRCDTQETCSGNSSICPADVVVPNGQSCGNGDLACASGWCTSIAEQCSMVGSGMNLTRACPDRSDQSCQISCQDPRQANVCITLKALVVDGSPCGYGGYCQQGKCASGGVWETVKAWYRQNLQIAIPVTIVAGLIVLLILWGIFKGIRRCCSGGRTKSPVSLAMNPAIGMTQHRRLPSTDAFGTPNTPYRNAPPTARDQYAAVPPAAAHDRSRSGQQSTDLGYNYNANNRANWVDDRTYNGYTGYTGR